MAEILIRVSDGSEGHLAFDPVRVQEDDEPWGRLESLDIWVSEGNTPESWPKRGVFVIIKVSGAVMSIYKFLEEPELVEVERDNVDGQRERSFVDIRSRGYVTEIISTLNAKDLLKIQNGGTIELSSNDFKYQVKPSDVQFKDVVINRLKARDSSLVEIVNINANINASKNGK